MPSRRLLTFLLLIALASAAAPLSAQQSVDITQPIAVRKARPPKPEKFSGQVTNSAKTFITVRSSDNAKLIRTFSFDPKLQPRMAQIASSGGYQYGDKVTVISEPGSNVALQVHGKPSR